MLGAPLRLELPPGDGLRSISLSLDQSDRYSLRVYAHDTTALALGRLFFGLGALWAAVGPALALALRDVALLTVSAGGIAALLFGSILLCITRRRTTVLDVFVPGALASDRAAPGQQQPQQQKAAAATAATATPQCQLTHIRQRGWPGSAQIVTKASLDDFLRVESFPVSSNADSLHHVGLVFADRGRSNPHSRTKNTAQQQEQQQHGFVDLVAGGGWTSSTEGARDLSLSATDGRSDLASDPPETLFMIVQTGVSSRELEEARRGWSAALVRVRAVLLKAATAHVRHVRRESLDGSESPPLGGARDPSLPLDDFPRGFPSGDLPQTLDSPLLDGSERVGLGGLSAAAASAAAAAAADEDYDSSSWEENSAFD